MTGNTVWLALDKLICQCTSSIAQWYLTSTQCHAGLYSTTVHSEPHYIEHQLATPLPIEDQEVDLLHSKAIFNTFTGKSMLNADNLSNVITNRRRVIGNNSPSLIIAEDQYSIQL